MTDKLLLKELNRYQLLKSAEAAGVGAFSAFLFSLFREKMTLKTLVQRLISTGRIGN